MMQKVGALLIPLTSGLGGNMPYFAGLGLKAEQSKGSQYIETKIMKTHLRTEDTQEIGTGLSPTPACWRAVGVLSVPGRAFELNTPAIFDSNRFCFFLDRGLSVPSK